MKIQNIDEDEAKLQAQRETFVASISHDLKNPTIAQIRALELFLKGSFGQIPPKQKEIIQMVLDSCRYMNAMLCSLLATYRFDSGKVKLNCEDFSIYELASECIEEIIFLARDKNVNISLKNTAKTETVFGDRVQIKRVVMNLLSNGIKYAYPNTNIIVRTCNNNENTCFSFENKSPYITPEKQEKIFGRYISYADTHNEFGIGLGLYASKKIIEAHNGNIYVKSYQDERNIFGFNIPYNDIYKNKERVVIF